VVDSGEGGESGGAESLHDFCDWARALSARARSPPPSRSATFICSPLRTHRWCARARRHARARVEGGRD